MQSFDFQQLLIFHLNQLAFRWEPVLWVGLPLLIPVAGLLYVWQRLLPHQRAGVPLRRFDGFTGLHSGRPDFSPRGPVPPAAAAAGAAAGLRGPARPLAEHGISGRAVRHGRGPGQSSQPRPATPSRTGRPTPRRARPSTASVGPSCADGADPRDRHGGRRQAEAVHRGPVREIRRPLLLVFLRPQAVRRQPVESSSCPTRRTPAAIPRRSATPSTRLARACRGKVAGVLVFSDGQNTAGGR